MDKEFWHQILDKRISDIARASNINPEDIEWCASYHSKKGHPHVHVDFWDRNQNLKTNKKPFLDYGKIKNVVAKEVFANDLEKLYETKNISKKQIKDVTEIELENFKNSIKENLKNDSLNFEIVDTTKEENLIKNITKNLKNKEKIYIYNKENPEEFVEIQKNIFTERQNYYGNKYETENEVLTFKNNGKNSILYKENDFSDSCSFLASFENLGIEKDKKVLENLINNNTKEKQEIDNLLKEIEPQILPNNIFSNEYRKNYFNEIVERISRLPDFIKHENEKNNIQKMNFRYSYQCASVKNEIDKISNLILSASGDVKKEFDNYVSSSIDIARTLGEVSGKNTRDYNRVMQSAKDELYNKMGNQILQNLKNNLNENKIEKQNEFLAKKEEYEKNKELYKEKQEEFLQKQKEFEHIKNVNNVRGLINNIFNILNTENFSQSARYQRLRKSFGDMTKEEKLAEIKKKQNSNGYEWFPGE